MTLLVTLAALALSASPDLPVMQGGKLVAGESCYALVSNGRTLGATLQTVSADEVAGRPVWDIVVHQRIGSAFEMRDHLVVDRETLRPLRMSSRSGRERTGPRWHAIDLEYSDGQVTGTRLTAEGETPINHVLNGPTWDGNLWGLTFAALPLEDGASFELPNWQYDKGDGAFVVRVKGRGMVDTPAGPVEAWILEAGVDPAQLATYHIATDDRRELGYAMGPMQQRLGGDCSAIPAGPMP